MRSPRPGSRALSPVRGRVVDTSGEETTIDVGDGVEVTVPIRSVILAQHEKVCGCPKCGLPMFRGGVCWTCRVLAEKYQPEEEPA